MKLITSYKIIILAKTILFPSIAIANTGSTELSPVLTFLQEISMVLLVKL